MKILYVVNDLDFFISHRIVLAIKAVEQGNTVYVASNKLPDFEFHNIKFKKFVISRSSTSFVLNLKSLIQLKRIIKDISPEIIHCVTLKSILITNLTLFFNKKIIIINAVSGMGYLFTNRKLSLASILVNNILKLIVLTGKSYFIFQNKNDLEEFKRFGLKENYSIIKGSGVDQNDFKFTPSRPSKKIKISFTGRILKDKGVLDLINAIMLFPANIRSKIELNLYGKIDYENPSHIKESDLKKLLIPDFIEWHGYSKNIKRKLIDCDIYCLPSYREGIPKSSIEAMAIGRPIVTTNAPGCRDTVRHSYNGFKVDVGDVGALKKKIKVLIEDRDLRLKMGKNSRALFVKKFTLEKVVRQTFELYDKVLKQ